MEPTRRATRMSHRARWANARARASGACADERGRPMTSHSPIRSRTHDESTARTSFWSAALLLIVLLAATLPGCGNSNDANASSGAEQSGDVKQAANSKSDGDEKKGDEKDSDASDADKEEKTEEAVPVEVTELARGSIESVLRFSSNLEAERQVKVISQAKRLVTKLLVEEGDRVRRDQPLLRLQDDEQRSAVEKVKSQLAKAQREYRQQERLFQQELIPQQDFDNATYEMEQLQIALADAERELSYTEVRAPIAGTVTGRMVNLGDQVQINQELFEIVDFASIVARVFVPEKHLAELRNGLPTRIAAQTGSRDGYDGRVKRIAPVVDPRSGTVKVTIDVGAQGGLRPGMYVDVDLITATHSDAVLVPKRALVYDSDQIFVYRLIEANRVERVFIEPRLTDKHYIEPVDGLGFGDRIVVAGQAGLKEGALVSLPGEVEEDDDARSEGGVEAKERAAA